MFVCLKLFKWTPHRRIVVSKSPNRVASLACRDRRIFLRNPYRAENLRRLPTSSLKGFNRGFDRREIKFRVFDVMLKGFRSYKVIGIRMGQL